MFSLRRRAVLEAVRGASSTLQASIGSSTGSIPSLRPSIRTFYDFGASSNDTNHNNTFSTNAREKAMYQMGVTNGSVRSRTVPLSRRRRLPNRFNKNRPQLTGNLYPVSAIHIAQTIDLYPLINTVFARNTLKKKMFGKNSVVVQMAPVMPNDPPRYIAVFRFGSIVCFNMSPKEVSAFRHEIKKDASEHALQGFERKENFGVLVRDNTIYCDQDEEPFAVTGDYCVVPELDMNGVAVISNIMAQTVALDTYNDTVDDLLANFAAINASVTKTGSFTATDKNFFFKTVAQNNGIFIDMISKIRIKDRSDTAWNLTKYETIHYSMKEEFELDDRFEHIEFKLNLIQQNAMFFMEVLQSQKSNSLEWIIVVLIGVECCLMCVDMSGMGESMFASIAKLLPPSA